MKSFSVAFLLLILSNLSAQTHFTIPQNVWRITYNKEHTLGNWKAKKLSSGMKHVYRIDTKTFSINQYFKRTINQDRLKIEYGFTDNSTLILNIPYIHKLKENRSWSLTNDSSSASLDTLFNYYYPTPVSNNGLSDITMGINLLIRGVPAWRGGKQKFSLYTGLDIIFPFAEQLKKYNSNSTDKNGIPNQFKHLPLGEGLTEIRLRVFGELYRKGWGRLFNINWSVGVSSFQKDIINPPISFLWIENASADSISKTIGTVVRKKSPQINGMLKAQIELIPKRVFFSSGIDWIASGRDKYYSNNEKWNKWMTRRDGYDSQKMQTSQFVKLNLFNLDPFLVIGPVPFELEIGARWFIPYPLTYHSYGNLSSWLQISTYFQAW
ncbi:MAG: hypothetical protein VYB52_00965 [Candidatus Neomarinimicrobiota bacterium]|nr:hypothetical protein [Candidatus Neomarinimicrobiota bacterium]